MAPYHRRGNDRTVVAFVCAAMIHIGIDLVKLHLLMAQNSKLGLILSIAFDSKIRIIVHKLDHLT